jgi:uncharacterized protein YcbK (DUF882 family)
MVTFKEMIGNASIADVPMTHIHNIETLLRKVNLLRDAWAKPMIVTSGYRTHQDHIRIYTSKGIPLEKIPMGSQHLIGCAIDIYDPELKLTAWLKENDSSRLQALGLYAEEGNSNWVHLQLNPPKSNKRWFLP